MKKVLIVATNLGFLGNFERAHVKSLLDMGYEVHLAANENLVGNVVNRNELMSMNIVFHNVDFSRKPMSYKNIAAIGNLREIVREDFEIVHCHTPVAAFCTRIACRSVRKMGTRVIYTAHGFHFFKGAAIKNWILYYPIEWICAFLTDELITINKEDYVRAKKHMHAKHVAYVPGVGVDLKKFSGIMTLAQISEKKKALNLPEKSQIILSVGELNKNKNHELVIRALARLNNKELHYVIAGNGVLKDRHMDLANELSIGDRVHFVGYRTDIVDLYKIADLYVHPSIREGLPVALMEAIASKIPVICSSIRGSMDLVVDAATFSPYDVEELVEKIDSYLGSDRSYEIAENFNTLSAYSEENVLNLLNKIYFETVT